MTVLLVVSVVINITSFAGKDVHESNHKLSEREALTKLVTSPEYMDWLIDIRENRPTNFPVVSYFGIESDEYVFSLRENNGVINANHGFYYINSNSGELKSQY